VISSRSRAAALALLCAAAVAGCGFGAGKESGSAQLRITRDYGSTVDLAKTEDGIPASQTVLRLLDANADVTTRYGGGFVQSIGGAEGTSSGARRFDWFFYVNGVESAVGSADVKVRDGDRIWWDYRDWTDAMRVPAVVGSWPEPFVHGFDGDVHRTRVDCVGAMPACTSTKDALAGQGVKAGVFEAEQAPGFDAESEPTLRVIVGPWDRVVKDPAAAQIDEGPERSGVFARFERGGKGYRLLGLGRDAKEVSSFGPGTGLIAAVRLEDAPPTWVVTGTDQAGVDAAAAALSEMQLRDRYAVVVPPGQQPLPLPIAVAR
jgi:hypothetical protein